MRTFTEPATLRALLHHIRRRDVAFKKGISETHLQIGTCAVVQLLPQVRPSLVTSQALKIWIITFSSTTSTAMLSPRIELMVAGCTEPSPVQTSTISPTAHEPGTDTPFST